MIVGSVHPSIHLTLFQKHTQGDWRLALDLLHDMKKEGLRPDYYSYQVS